MSSVQAIHPQLLCCVCINGMDAGEHKDLAPSHSCSASQPAHRWVTPEVLTPLLVFECLTSLLAALHQCLHLLFRRMLLRHLNNKVMGFLRIFSLMYVIQDKLIKLSVGLFFPCCYSGYALYIVEKMHICFPQPQSLRKSGTVSWQLWKTSFYSFQITS